MSLKIYYHSHENIHRKFKRWFLWILIIIIIITLNLAYRLVVQPIIEIYWATTYIWRDIQMCVCSEYKLENIGWHFPLLVSESPFRSVSYIRKQCTVHHICDKTKSPLCVILLLDENNNNNGIKNLKEPCNVYTWLL